MSCSRCPHRCAADRARQKGLCRCGEEPAVARTMLHRWEEPCISGERGTGAVFFAGCNLRCVYCQNSVISRDGAGYPVYSACELCALFFSLRDAGAHNISLISPAQYAIPLAGALALAREKGLGIPFIYNTNAYESVETLRALEGLVDVYLPDFKYFDNAAALRYSGAPHYVETAAAAIWEMMRQTGAPIIGPGGLITRGTMVRHLLLPGRRHDAIRILDWIAETLPGAGVSLMAQYVPLARAADFPELNRRVTTFEYDSVVRHLLTLPVETGYVQRREAASPDFVPAFRVRGPAD